MKLSIALLCAVCGAFAQDVSGKWSGIFREGPIYVILKQDGAKLSGTGGPSEKTQMLEFKDGSVDGDHVIFANGSFHFDLRVNGDTMRGEFTTKGDTTKIYLKRVVNKPGAISFEVASVKRAQEQGGNRFNSSTKLDPGRLTCTNVTLKRLLTISYEMKDYQISGPDWLDSERYDIVATMPRDTTGDEAIRMVQSLLAERFHIAVHHESKELPVYALVIGKNGPKLTEVEFGRSSTDTSPGKYIAKGANMTNLANFLSRALDRPVLDMTGLKAFYDFTLEWTPDKAPEVGVLTDSAVGPSLTLALHQQLGLKVETRKAPIDVLVIDRAEKIPTEN